MIQFQGSKPQEPLLAGSSYRTCCFPPPGPSSSPSVDLALCPVSGDVVICCMGCHLVTPQIQARNLFLWNAFQGSQRIPKACLTPPSQTVLRGICVLRSC